MQVADISYKRRHGTNEMLEGGIRIKAQPNSQQRTLSAE
jgi:hypothetical protein